MANEVIGMTSASSRFPCPFGKCRKDGNGNWIPGEDRSLENLAEANEDWLLNGDGKKENLKYYFNVRNLPLIGEKKNMKVILLIPPPPLHLIRLGPTNHLLEELRLLCPEILMEFCRKIHIVRSGYHGRCFEGNGYANNILIKFFELDLLKMITKRLVGRIPPPLYPPLLGYRHLIFIQNLL